MPVYSHPHLRGWTLGTALVGMLLLTGCTAGGGATRDTPTPAAAAPLAWQPVALPPGFPYSQAGVASVFPVAFAGDGVTAYACDASGISGSPPHVFATHDRAAHWARVADVPAPPTTAICVMVVDAENPLSAVAVVSSARPTGGFGLDVANYATGDGGHSWRLLPERIHYFITELASTPGVVYALRAEPDLGPLLYSSHDGMRTWRQIGAQITGLPDSFWLDPSSGALLVAATAGAGTPQLWRSDDGGQTWAQLSPPAFASLAVQAPAAGQPWHICVASYAQGASTSQINSLACSADGGQTWTPRPARGGIQAGGNGSSALQDSLLAIADDGAILWSVYNHDGSAALYRLMPGATVWQSLGSVPSAGGQVHTLTYEPAPGKGMLWALANAPADQNPLFAAAYV
jgi:photosystem II stability/assembly factor-like uncharacterized protein